MSQASKCDQVIARTGLSCAFQTKKRTFWTRFRRQVSYGNHQDAATAMVRLNVQSSVARNYCLIFPLHSCAFDTLLCTKVQRFCFGQKLAVFTAYAYRFNEGVLNMFFWTIPTKTAPYTMWKALHGSYSAKCCTTTASEDHGTEESFTSGSADGQASG